MHIARAVAAALFLVCVTNPAAAQDGEEQARALFEQGKQLRDQGDWQGACRHFEEAHATFASGGTTFVSADCAERADRPKDARALYEKVLQDQGSQDNPDRLRQARERIAAIDAKLSAETEKKPPPPPLPAPKQPDRVMDPIPGGVLLGVGGAALVVGGVLGGLALSESDAVRESCTNDVCPADQQSAYESAQGTAIGADISFAIGGAAVITGIVLLLVLKSDAPPLPVALTPSSFAIRF